MSEPLQLSDQALGLAVGVAAALEVVAAWFAVLGGWAAPLSALLIGGPGVPSDLAELGSTLRHANRQAVVARRESWHQVLPVEEVDDLVDQPWERFARQAGSSPSSLLLAEHAVVPYLFREQEVEDAVTWCASPAAMSITTVAGRGGAGKTRFAVELCRLMAARGWVAGMWRPDRQPPAVAVPRLIVIDYVEAAEPRALRDALDGCVGAQPISHPSACCC